LEFKPGTLQETLQGDPSHDALVPESDRFDIAMACPTSRHLFFTMTYAEVN